MPVSEEEKAFGISQKQKNKKQTMTGILLRNWVTYLLRECISREERAAHYSAKPNIEKAKEKFNQAIEFEIYQKVLQYSKDNNLIFLDEMITHSEVLCIKQNDGEYQAK